MLLDDGLLFERSLCTTGVPSTLPLPSALIRRVFLVLEICADSGALLELPRTLARLLGAQLIAAGTDGIPPETLDGRSRASIAMATVQARQHVVHCASRGDGIDLLGAGLEINASGVGRFVEVSLLATGDTPDTVVVGAVSMLRTRLPRSVILEISFATAPILDCLQRVSLSLLAELNEAAHSCEALLAACDEPAASSATSDYARCAGAMQSTTDAYVAALHCLLQRRASLSATSPLPAI